MLDFDGFENLQQLLTSKNQDDNAYAIQATDHPETLPMLKAGRDHLILHWFGCAYHLYRLSYHHVWIRKATWMWVLESGSIGQECGVGFHSLKDCHKAVIAAIRQRHDRSEWKSPFYFLPATRTRPGGGRTTRR